ncbi:MAG: TetR family transcriptional regulator C-terminal domain-containing protein [Leptospiraceae bacterium]|nr:TetR family transcriptional regulator C-terminal domain-containing protein [Leptospiraceae bacterium]
MQAKTTREKIIDDCLALIWRNGVNGTSMSDIADKAAILKGSFYNYFKSKEEFVSAVLDSYAAKWETNVVAIFREKKTNARAKFKAYFERMKEMASSMQYTQGSLVGNFAQELSGASEKFAQQAEKIFRRMQSYLADALREAQQNGALAKTEDPELLAEIILNSTEGAILRAKTARSTRPIEILEQFFLQKLSIA